MKIMRLGSLYQLLFIGLLWFSPVNTWAQSKIVFLVRHAEKADDGTRNPDLNEDGWARANQLAKILEAAEIEFIYSTDFKRTLQTGLPLAKALDKSILKYSPLDSLALDKILQDTGSSRILIIGHSNTIPKLVNQLIGEERYHQLGENEYDKLFFVILNGNKSDCVVLKF